MTEHFSLSLSLFLECHSLIMATRLHGTASVTFVYSKASSGLQFAYLTPSNESHVEGQGAGTEEHSGYKINK